MKDFPTPEALMAMDDDQILVTLRVGFRDVFIMILAARLRGHTSTRVPQDMIGGDEMRVLVDLGYAIAGMWYVSYQPGYIIKWK